MIRKVHSDFPNTLYYAYLCEYIVKCINNELIFRCF